MTRFGPTELFVTDILIYSVKCKRYIWTDPPYSRTSQVMRLFREAFTTFVLSQDSFYRGLNPEEMANVGEYNFDHPGELHSR